MPCISFPLVSVLSRRALRVSGEPIYSRSDHLAHADISSGEISAFVTWPPEPSAMTLQRPAIALFEEVLGCRDTAAYGFRLSSCPLYLPSTMNCLLSLQFTRLYGFLHHYHLRLVTQALSVQRVGRSPSFITDPSSFASDLVWAANDIYIDRRTPPPPPHLPPSPNPSPSSVPPLLPNFESADAAGDSDAGSQHVCEVRSSACKSCESRIKHIQNVKYLFFCFLLTLRMF